MPINEPVPPPPEMQEALRTLMNPKRRTEAEALREDIGKRDKRIADLTAECDALRARVAELEAERDQERAYVEQARARSDHERTVRDARRLTVARVTAQRDRLRATRGGLQRRIAELEAAR